ncbi:MAG TPA: hypothetical protein VIN69_05080 [Candidatus Limnocylindria bacterium]
MPAGEGKGWAKGRSAKVDPRIARAGAAHRGMRYVPRRPFDDRRRRSGTVDTNWSPTLAYAVGLIATDGCIVRGRTVSFPSADRELVEILLACLQKRNQVSVIRTRAGGVAYRTQIGDVAFCRWLMSIGIAPRKSLTIGSIDAPDHLLVPLVRGLLDGDGSIINKVARADTKGRKDYRWEYLRTTFVSASRGHIAWLRDRVHEVLRVDGYIALARGRGGHHDQYTRRFGKRGSLVLLPLLYADPRAPRLARKWHVWADYAKRHGLEPSGQCGLE